MRLMAVILAGGEGRRIGGGKALRQLGGERLIDRAIRLAKMWTEDVRVAVRSPDQIPDLDVGTLVDDPSLAGPLAGLGSALAAAEASAVRCLLTLPCDTPFLPGDLAPRLIDAIGERQAAVAATGDDLHPTCALWRATARPSLAEYASTGRRSLKGFADMVGCTRVEWPAACFLNVNTAEELAEAERRLGSEVDDLRERPDRNRDITRS